MRYLILGLGIYGSNLARDLTDMGHEVIGVDSSQANVDSIKDYISTVYHMDVTEESSLALLPLNNVDLVIVSIGENFGASIKVVAILKKLHVKHIYARAIDHLHESILMGFDLDRILTPEQRAARDLTFEMGLDSHVQTLAIDDEHYVLKFQAPSHLIGLKYSEIDFQKSYKLQLVAITRQENVKNLLGIARPTSRVIDWDADTVVTEGDEIVCMGSRKAYFSFFRNLNN